VLSFKLGGVVLTGMDLIQRSLSGDLSMAFLPLMISFDRDFVSYHERRFSSNFFQMNSPLQAAGY
jgi:hypothetical protein